MIHGKNLDNARKKVIAFLLPGLCMHFHKLKAIKAQFVGTVHDCRVRTQPLPPCPVGTEWRLAENGWRESHYLLLISTYICTYALTPALFNELGD